MDDSTMELEGEQGGLPSGYAEFGVEQSESSNSEDNYSDSLSEDGSADLTEAEKFMGQIGVRDHYDQVTSQIIPSGDEDSGVPESLLNEDNKHYFTARALGVRRKLLDDVDYSGDDAFNELTGVLQDQLTDMGMDEPRYHMDDSLRSGSGWQDRQGDAFEDILNNRGKVGDTHIYVSSANYSADTLWREDVQALYHESVHGEQWSLAKEVLDGDNENPSDRVARLAEENHPNNQDIVAQIQAEGGEMYRLLPSEQEAYQADGDVGRMYEQVGAMHDELELKQWDTREQLDAEAEQRAQEIGEYGTNAVDESYDAYNRILNQS